MCVNSSKINKRQTIYTNANSLYQSDTCDSNSTLHCIYIVMMQEIS